MFVRATLNDGSQFVSEFDRLNGIRNLASNVFSGRRPFPIWRVTSTEHPFSFEPTLLRTREFVNGKMLRSLQVVEPIADDHGYDPLLFRPITRVSNGTAGTYRFTPETMPEGVDADVSPDIDYPCHRHPDGRRFVILKMGARSDEANVEYFLDAEAGIGSDINDAMEPWDDEENLV